MNLKHRKMTAKNCNIGDSRDEKGSGSVCLCVSMDDVQSDSFAWFN